MNCHLTSKYFSTDCTSIFVSLQSLLTSTSSFSFNHCNSFVADLMKSNNESRSFILLVLNVNSSAYTFCNCPKCWLYRVSSSPLKYCLAFTQVSTFEWNWSICLCSRWWTSLSVWTEGRSVPYSSFFSCFWKRSKYVWWKQSTNWILF